MSSARPTRWKLKVLRGKEEEKRDYGFGHDFRRFEYWIVDVSSGKRVALLNPQMTRDESLWCGRILASSPNLLAACETAESRLAKATHQNAKALYQVIATALESLHEKNIEYAD